jgi:hypothetical protein
MDRRILLALAVAASLAAPAAVQARFSIGAGDLIFSDGQTFTYDEWEEYKKTHPADGSAPAAPAQQQPQQQQYLQPPRPPAQYQAQPQYQPQYQAPPTTTVVNGQPVVKIAPPPVYAPLPIQGGPSVAAAPPPLAAPQPAVTYAAAPALRSASCRTTRSYQEFPGEAEKFDCGAAGQLTRQEMAAQGWKTDFVEKLPAVAGQPSPNIYKIILSR